ncbi:Putative 115 kDa protein in type-1 retrotransposable element R1DM [Anthophora quadrimaculata]
MEGAYKAKRAALRLAIKEAKAQAWKELLGSLDRDPWRRPYRLVLGRLRPYAPPVTEGLDPQVLGRVVDALFPSHSVGRGGCSRPVPEETADQVWSVELGVTKAELGDAIKKMAARDTAPGPDGIPGKVWALALGVLGPQLRRLFDRCLELGQFPPQWRRGRMVLLKKEGPPADSPSTYRPICLLDEAGKLFETVLASRLVHHLSAVGPDLCEEQYGFRKGRPTLDAIRRVRTLAEAAVSEGGVAMAIYLDIVNAFNTLPWEPPRSWVRVGVSHVRVRTQMKYLGLTLDRHWRFEAHFEQLVPRVERTAAALGRLLPNLRGPEMMVRRLYAGVVRLMALYGSPVCSGDGSGGVGPAGVAGGG